MPPKSSFWQPSSHPDDDAAAVVLLAERRPGSHQPAGDEEGTGEMRTAQDYEPQGRYSLAPDLEAPSGLGWVTFASVMLGLAGIWNSIAGILAISSSRVYTGHSVLVFGNLNTWGWIVLLLGIVQLIASAALFAGSEFARWFGIAAAGVNATGQLRFLPAYPWWAIAMFTVDLLVIYGLAVYAGSRLRAV